MEKEVYCENCKTVIDRQFRFTDWDYDQNDEYGNFEDCLRMFNEAVKEDPQGRFSIYAVTICKECDECIEDEGVLFNDNCPAYK